MLFSSISFIYYFLPIVLIIYYICPRKHKNLFLMFASLCFYFVGEPVYILLLLLSTVVDYTHSKIIVKHRGCKKAKAALISSIMINLSMLAVFKYADFFVMNINMIFSTTFTLPRLALPIGISFFTFQTMSYTVDVYRGEAKVQNSIVGLGTYVSLFPQLIAGPIVRYKTIAEELVDRKHNYEHFSYGVKRFVIGLSKKVLIANTLGELAEMIYHTNDVSVLYYWITALAYALQIYFDFSGYSDMAIGLGRLFGFHFLENFNYPYISKSITEFWRRWHISLGQWFRDYVYIPLGGNRKGTFIWYRNIVIVWFLTGLWHGASWNFVIWGMVFAVLLVIEKKALLLYLNKSRILSHIYVLFIVIVSFVIFKNDSFDIMIDQLKSMFFLTDIPLSSKEAVYYLKSYLYAFILAGLGATPLVNQTIKRLKGHDVINNILKYIEPVVIMVLLIIVTGYLVDSSFNPFLYFRF